MFARSRFPALHRELPLLLGSAAAAIAGVLTAGGLEYVETGGPGSAETLKNGVLVAGVSLLLTAVAAVFIRRKLAMIYAEGLEALERLAGQHIGEPSADPADRLDQVHAALQRRFRALADADTARAAELDAMRNRCADMARRSDEERRMLLAAALEHLTNRPAGGPSAFATALIRNLPAEPATPAATANAVAPAKPAPRDLIDEDELDGLRDLLNRLDRGAARRNKAPPATAH